MTEEKKNKAWGEIQTFTEPNTGLTLVVTERIRGPHAYSYSIGQKDDRGIRMFIAVPVQGLDKVPVEGDRPATTGDVIRALVDAAEVFIANHKPKARPERKDGKGNKKDRRVEKPQNRDKKPQGGLSALAKMDAEAKGLPYKTRSQKKREKRQRGRTNKQD